MESLEEARAGRAHNRELAAGADFHDINWQHYTHPQLYDMVMTPDPGYIRAQSGQWTSVGDAIDATTAGVRAVLHNLFVTWQGAAAESSRASNAMLDRWATEMTQRTHQTAARLGDYSEALEMARRRMPPPEFAWAEHAADQGNSFKWMSGPSGDVEWTKFTDDRQPDFQKHHEAWLEAVRVMQDYGQQSQAAHDTLPPPPDPAPSTAHVDSPVVSRPPDQNWLLPDRPPGDPVPLPPPVPGSGHSGVPGDIDGDGIPDGTTPGGYTSPGGGSGTGPGTGYGSGAGLAAGLGSGSGADVARGGPAGGPFGGAGSLAARGGAGGMAGVRGAAGAGAFPPFGAGGAGAQGEEDKEHKNKFDEGLDLFDDLPPAYPPVFGA